MYPIGKDSVSLLLDDRKSDGTRKGRRRKKREEAGLFLLPLKKAYSLLSGIKDILAKSADGADPILGDIFPRRTGGDAAVRIAEGRIINIAAGALILHGKGSFPILTCRNSA